MLIHDANIKEENIIDSKCSLNWGECTSLQIKKRKTLIVCIQSQNLQKGETLCYNKKKHNAYCDYWLACVEWMDLKPLNIISKHLHRN